MLWAEHFESQINWPKTIPMYISWFVSINLSFETEILKGIEALRRPKAPGTDVSSPTLLEDGEVGFIKEVHILLSKVSPFKNSFT